MIAAWLAMITAKYQNDAAKNTVKAFRRKMLSAAPFRLSKPNMLSVSENSKYEEARSMKRASDSSFIVFALFICSKRLVLRY